MSNPHSESIVFKLILLDFAVDLIRLAISCELYIKATSIFVHFSKITKVSDNIQPWQYHLYHTTDC